VLDVSQLIGHRGLEKKRFENLLMKEKAVALPCEDPVTFAVNAAKPIVDALTPQEKDRIELLITCTESGIDFGKSISTYVHRHLDLGRNCRLFEIKQACYSGTAGLQMAINLILSQTSPGAKALVVTSDISRFIVAEGGDALSADWTFAEPSGGAGAVAMIVSDQPDIFQLDIGANGFYGHEIMDTCRPMVDSEAGDSDLSLMSYLDCCEATFKEYSARVPGSDYRRTFDYLIFHTPFGGMVKGAHRTMMRKTVGANSAEIEVDFSRRVMPGLRHCQRVGNIMGGTVFLALASTIEHLRPHESARVGCFSYGSGCCAEFYSGVVNPNGPRALRDLKIGQHLDHRYQLSISEYESVLQTSRIVRFGTRNVTVDPHFLQGARRAGNAGRRRLYLRAIREFHREYEWE
jgi:polyketide biosynthesis 3-hydroxy-3-methylglutaryl-CoA synthase-like enzyme PksG